MDVAQIVKSTQEQGVAAWVDYLNQLRLNELLAKLTSQNMNLEQALAELQKMKVNIAALIENNRGGAKGMHGFIAETAEVGRHSQKWYRNSAKVCAIRGAFRP